MSISLFNRYGIRANSPNSDYPDGSFKDESFAGAEDGTPVENDWANNNEGFFQRLRSLAGISANDSVDTASENQNVDSMETLFHSGTRPRCASLADLCSNFMGLSGRQWFSPNDSPNYKDLSGTVVDSCVGIDYNTGRPLIFTILSGTPGQLRKTSGCWDYLSNPSGSILVPILSPSAGEYLSICCDSEYLYLMYGSSDNHVYISKFSLNPLSMTPIATIEASDTYSYPAGQYAKYYKLIVASDLNLGFSAPHYDDNYPTFGILDKGLQVVVKYSLPTSYKLDGKASKIISDGSNFYSLAYDIPVSDKRWYLVTLPHSDMSSYSMGLIGTSSIWQSDPMGILNIGDSIVISRQSGLIRFYSKTENDFMNCVKITNFHEYITAPYENFGSILGFDGMNVWFCGLDTRNYGGTESPYIALFKIPAEAFHYLGSQTTVTELVKLPVVINNYAITENYQIGNILFDGKDIWLIMRSGDAYRIVNPAVR